MNITKYKSRVVNLRKSEVASSKELPKIVDSLVFAAWVMPCGRPFISNNSHFIDVKDVYKKVRLDLAALMACDLWLFLLEENRGLAYEFYFGTPSERCMVRRYLQSWVRRGVWDFILPNFTVKFI